MEAVILSALGSDDVFPRLMDYFQSYYEKAASTLIELKARNTKTKGDLFELFCQLYFQAQDYEVWTLHDLPDDIRQNLGLNTRDFGIDLIARKNGQYHAIQAKYRRRNSRRIVLGWKALSTFYALVARTGPWQTQWVITTADSVNRQGKKGTADRTLAYRGLCATPKTLWLKMAGSVGKTLNSEDNIPTHSANTGESKKETPATDLSDTIRQARLKYFEL